MVFGTHRKTDLVTESGLPAHNFDCDFEFDCGDSEMSIVIANETSNYDFDCDRSNDVFDNDPALEGDGDFPFDIDRLILDWSSDSDFAYAVCKAAAFCLRSCERAS